ncbi:MAG: RSP_2648 family PIN domain-containing protein [Boseongicola sp.]
MKVFIDTCVLFPTLTRELLMGFARAQSFEPLWSPEVLGEWRNVANKTEKYAPDPEINRLMEAFPKSLVEYTSETFLQLSLPDLNDIPILAAAIDGGAEELLTFNSRDFPSRTLARHDIIRRHPDEFLLEQFRMEPDLAKSIARATLQKAQADGFDASNPRKIFKRSLLPRLGKALYAS